MCAAVLEPHVAPPAATRGIAPGAPPRVCQAQAHTLSHPQTALVTHPAPIVAARNGFTY